jgi:hypothetical protein
VSFALTIGWFVTIVLTLDCRSTMIYSSQILGLRNSSSLGSLKNQHGASSCANGGFFLSYSFFSYDFFVNGFPPTFLAFLRCLILAWSARIFSLCLEGAFHHAPPSFNNLYLLSTYSIKASMVTSSPSLYRSSFLLIYLTRSSPSQLGNPWTGLLTNLVLTHPLP